MQDQTTIEKYEGPLQGISIIEDPRYQLITWYSIPEVLFLLLAGSISSCNSVLQIAAFGEEKLDWLRQYYPYKHGTPSHDTINRILSLIKPQQFERWFSEWVAMKFDIPLDDLLALDGKRLTSSANRMDQTKRKSEGGEFAKIVVNCLAVGSGIVLGQRDVSSKASEPEGARQLIESLDVEGKCISGDANFCGFKLLEFIIDNGADYLIALKGRNAKLHAAAQEVFADSSVSKVEFSTTEKGHGREETRLYSCLSAAAISDEITAPYPQLKTVIKVERQRRETRKQADPTTEVHYYITTLTKDLEQLAHKVRGHWAIENSLHHVLDVSFEEDASRSRKGHAATNFSIVRKLAINFLIPGKSKAGLKTMRTRAALSDKRRAELMKI